MDKSLPLGSGSGSVVGAGSGSAKVASASASASLSKEALTTALKSKVSKPKGPKTNVSKANEVNSKAAKSNLKPGSVSGSGSGSGSTPNQKSPTKQLLDLEIPLEDGDKKWEAILSSLRRFKRCHVQHALKNLRQTINATEECLEVPFPFDTTVGETEAQSGLQTQLRAAQTLRTAVLTCVLAVFQYMLNDTSEMRRPHSGDSSDDGDTSTFLSSDFRAVTSEESGTSSSSEDGYSDKSASDAPITANSVRTPLEHNVDRLHKVKHRSGGFIWPSNLRCVRWTLPNDGCATIMSALSMLTPFAPWISPQCGYSSLLMPESLATFLAKTVRQDIEQWKVERYAVHVLCMWWVQWLSFSWVLGVFEPSRCPVNTSDHPVDPKKTTHTAQLLRAWVTIVFRGLEQTCTNRMVALWDRVMESHEIDGQRPQPVSHLGQDPKDRCELSPKKCAHAHRIIEMFDAQAAMTSYWGFKPKQWHWQHVTSFSQHVLLRHHPCVSFRLLPSAHSASPKNRAWVPPFLKRCRQTLSKLASR